MRDDSLMGNPGFGGRYQYHATVSAFAPRLRGRTKVKVVVWADNRDDALQVACEVASVYGYSDCTVNHITKVIS